MRELKFRQWIEKSKQFHYWGFFEDRFESPATGLGVTFKDAHRCSDQFTGLHDKTGKEIYEGDRVEHEDGQIGVVLWSQGQAGFFVDNYPGGRFISDKFEIIGNIHEEGK